MRASRADVPMDAGSQAIRILRAELGQALWQCTKRQRKYLKALPEHDYQLWSCAEKTGISKSSVHRWNRQPEFLRVLAALDKMGEVEIGLSLRMGLTKLKHIINVDIRDFYDAEGNIKPRGQWTQAMADAVAEDYEDRYGRRLKLYSRPEAIALVVKIKGWGAPEVLQVNTKVDHNGDADSLSDEELATIAGAGSPAPPQPKTRTLQ